ncbi:MAG: pilin [Oscillospiraceae bacterium]
MKKIKFLLKNTLNMGLASVATLPMTMQVVSAADESVDLSTAKLGPDGKLQIDGAGNNSTTGTVNVFNTIMSKGRLIVSGVTGVLAVVMVGIFTYKAFHLSQSSENPQERAKAINGLIFYFIGAACFGAASLFSGLFYNLFR